MTKIEWTDKTWNPWWGCSEIAPECGTDGGRCYAAVIASRGLIPEHKGIARGGIWSGRVSHSSESVWEAPFSYPHQSRVRPGGSTLVFTCSMSDFWHEDVPLGWLVNALDIIQATPHLIYQVLTKRPATALRKLEKLNRVLPRNVWFGVTIGHPQSLPLLKPLRRVDATLKFLSVEPLLAPMVPGLVLDEIGWVICGGQSGTGARPCDPDWVRTVRDLCLSHDVPFFLKQWGTWNNNPTPPAHELHPEAKGGATLDGRLWSQFPALERRRVRDRRGRSSERRPEV
jgi:protein gp37